MCMLQNQQITDNRPHEDCYSAQMHVVIGERLSCLWLYPKTKRTITITDFPITQESKPNVVCKIIVQHSTLEY